MSYQFYFSDFDDITICSGSSEIHTEVFEVEGITLTTYLYTVIREKKLFIFPIPLGSPAVALPAD